MATIESVSDRVLALGMKPVRLTAHRKVVEADLQYQFDHWFDKQPSYFHIAGAPPWLPQTRPADIERTKKNAYGYGFIPDVLWRDGKKCWLLELKCGAKYEPIALAEVLHHKYLLQQLESGVSDFETGIFCSWSPWLRGAISALTSDGLRTGAIHLVECFYLYHGSARILWMDEALREWSPGSPKGMPKDFFIKYPNAFWYKVKDTDTWYGMAKEQPQRPVFIDEPHIIVTKVPSLHAHISCSLVPPKLGTNSHHDWQEENFLWTK